MPELSVLTNNQTHTIAFERGASVRELIEAAGLRVRYACSGNGACGLCLVRIEAGAVPAPTRTELLHLSPERIQQDMRLACQLLPQDDLCVRIIAAPMKAGWRDMTANPTFNIHPGHDAAAAGARPGAPAYGLAVDLGTTHLSLTLWDLQGGERLAGAVGLNPQSCWGADVMTRLIAAAESPHQAQAIARMPLEAIYEALRELCAPRGISPREVRRVCIVGNTPMLALLTESDPQSLLQPQTWTRPLNCRRDGVQAWAGLMGIDPEATVEIVDPFAGFVGSDLLAGVLATGLMDEPGGLLIDFGTNSEMALWDGATLWVTSAAGGPAFESCDMQCGMSAEPGAIYRVEWPAGAGDPGLHVLGGGAVKGLCGSGLVDLIAGLRDAGVLTPTGKFTPSHAGDGFIVHRHDPEIRLTSRDVDMFQRAKSAIGVGIKTLLGKAQLSPAQLSRMCICGAFGQQLNIGNAQRVGLLPQMPEESVELCGNTALAGCERVLRSGADGESLAALRQHATIVNLAQCADFDTLFLEQLYLEPMEVEAP